MLIDLTLDNADTDKGDPYNRDNNVIVISSKTKRKKIEKEINITKEGYLNKYKLFKTVYDKYTKMYNHSYQVDYQTTPKQNIIS